MSEPQAASPESSSAVAAPAGKRRGRRARTIAGMVLQVALIGVGVFLGLAGEEWRENRENVRQAQESLRRFRAEMAANHEIVSGVKDYHLARLSELEAFFASDRTDNAAVRDNFAGVKPPLFERSAWDVALATESLAHIDPDLAFNLARVYSFQQMTDDLGRGVMQTMFLRPPSDEDSTFLAAVHLYYRDLAELEPLLLQMYQDRISEIDAVLE